MGHAGPQGVCGVYIYVLLHTRGFLLLQGLRYGRVLGMKVLNAIGYLLFKLSTSLSKITWYLSLMFIAISLVVMVLLVVKIS